MRRFPAARSDGTFAVDVVLQADDAETQARLPAWLAAWHARNQAWERTWTDLQRPVRVELLRWADAFAGPPALVPAAPATLVVRLQGLATNHAWEIWRDWYARLVTEAQQAFPDLRLVEVRDAP